MKGRRIVTAVTDPIVIAIVAVLNLSPFAWSLLTSFKSDRDIYVFPIKITGFSPTIANYQYVLHGGHFFGTMLLTIGYCLAAIVACIVLASLASYAFARYRGRMMSFLFASIVIFGIPLVVGSSALIVSNFIVFSKMGIVNKIFSLPLIYTAYFLPMSIFICLGGMRNIPTSIEEAAIIDGCSRSYIIFNLIPRLNRPALACAALFVFVGAWNEFIVSSVLITSPQLTSIQVAVFNFAGFYGISYGPLMTATALSLVPLIVIFSFLGRQLISGLTAGAVKG